MTEHQKFVGKVCFQVLDLFLLGFWHSPSLLDLKLGLGWWQPPDLTHHPSLGLGLGDRSAHGKARQHNRELGFFFHHRSNSPFTFSTQFDNPKSGPVCNLRLSVPLGTETEDADLPHSHRSLANST